MTVAEWLEVATAAIGFAFSAVVIALGLIERAVILSKGED